MTGLSKLLLVALVAGAICSIIAVTILSEKIARYQNVAQQLPFDDELVSQAAELWIEDGVTHNSIRSREQLADEHSAFMVETPDQRCIVFVSRSWSDPYRAQYCFDVRTGNPVISSETIS